MDNRRRPVSKIKNSPRNLPIFFRPAYPFPTPATHSPSNRSIGSKREPAGIDDDLDEVELHIPEVDGTALQSVETQFGKPPEVRPQNPGLHTVWPDIPTEGETGGEFRILVLLGRTAFHGLFESQPFE